MFLHVWPKPVTSFRLNPCFCFFLSDPSEQPDNNQPSSASISTLCLPIFPGPLNSPISCPLVTMLFPLVGNSLVSRTPLVKKSILYPCSIKTREVLGNPSLMPKRVEGNLEGRGGGFPNNSRVISNLSYCSEDST